MKRNIFCMTIAGLFWVCISTSALAVVPATLQITSPLEDPTPGNWDESMIEQTGEVGAVRLTATAKLNPQTGQAMWRYQFSDNVNYAYSNFYGHLAQSPGMRGDNLGLQFGTNGRTATLTITFLDPILNPVFYIGDFDMLNSSVTIPSGWTNRTNYAAESMWSAGGTGNTLITTCSTCSSGGFAAVLYAGTYPAGHSFEFTFDYTNSPSFSSDGVGVGIAAGPRSSLNLNLSDGGAATYSTMESEGETQIGYATATVESGDDPYGVAVFSFRQNPIVSEAAVPASPPTTSARIFIDYRFDVISAPGGVAVEPVDIYTGIAVVNPGSATANLTYTLRNINGDEILATGTGTVVGNAHFAKFIHQLHEVSSNFNLPGNFPTDIKYASLDIDSDQPLSVMAIRLTVNQRGETIYTTTPIADLTEQLNNLPVYFPQFADGGGYLGTLILLNTSSSVETGTLSFFDGNGGPLAVTQVGALQILLSATRFNREEYMCSRPMGFRRQRVWGRCN